MKLVIKEYLTSLRERGELDALLPDLLSQMGLRVFSRPGRGTRQYGVDIGAIGKIEDSPEKVYLLSVKAGNLGRKDWDSGSEQDLRPSLNEILDVYIPTHLPEEYRNLPIDICICIGGDIEESVRVNITQYEGARKTEILQIVEWDGDRLASWIEKYFLQENLLPEGARPLLRKSLALLDEPQASFRHFTNLLNSLTQEKFVKDSQVLITLRQMNICLWILFAWAREAGNLESTYLAAERTLLYAWETAKKYFSKQTKIAVSIKMAFYAIHTVYQIILREYFSKILPYTGKKHGLSTAVHSTNKLDINLKLFEVLGRLALAGLWDYWKLELAGEAKEKQGDQQHEIEILAHHLKLLIINNPTLFLPVKDDHAIDIFLAILLLSLSKKNEQDIIHWLSQLLDKATFSYQTHGMYPCIHRDYLTLLNHPEYRNDDYRREATAGSILYPMIGLWAALLKSHDLYQKVQEAKKTFFAHCNFQFWYPDKNTEKHLYKNDDTHGATFSQLPIEQDEDTFLKEVWNECAHSDAFKGLSCVKAGMWPILLVACRHYRLPVPIDFTLGYQSTSE